ESNNIASLTYEFADGDPVTFSRSLSSYGGQRGLFVYLPVFRKPETETGQLKETLYINWGGGLTENIQFTSTTLSLMPLTFEEKTALQNEFNDSIFRSIDMDRPPYRGAEAVRRILSSDNPLGLPTSGNGGLDALNRALTLGDVRSVLEEKKFSMDLTVDTSGNSAYSKLSGDGKHVVAEAVLTGRKVPYATPSAVKAIFDKAVYDRLAAESSLLTAINKAGDAAILRRIIETAANAAILNFQIGADPYKSYPASQKDEMAIYLFSLRPYPSLQAVIDAIRDYLSANGAKEPDPKEAVISSVAASPRTITMASGNKREVVLTVNTSAGKMSSADIGKIATWSWNATGATSPLAGVTLRDDTLTLTANNPGKDTLTITVGGKTATVSVTVSPPKLATALKLNKSSLKLMAGSFERLTYTITPSDATDNLRWSSDNEAVCTVADGLVTAVGRGRAIVSLESADNPVLSSICEIWVFADENDIIITPDIITLGEGSTYQVKYEMYKPIQPGGNAELRWKTDNPNIATVSSSGLIRAVGSDHSQTLDSNKTVITAEVWAAGKPPSADSGSAHITVVVENRRSLEIQLTNAIMFQGERQSLDITRLLDPITKQPILPYAPGQQFIWEIKGTSVQFVISGQANSSSSITLSTTALPELQATGVGRSYISVKTSSGEQPIHTIEVVSVPKGVQNMRFYNNSKEITNAENYGRVLDILNNQTAQITTTEQDDTGRLMTWTTMEVDQFRKLGKPVTSAAGMIPIINRPIYDVFDSSGNIASYGVYDSDGAVRIGGSNGITFGQYQDLITYDYFEKNSTMLLAPGGLVTPQNNKTGLAAVHVTPVRDSDTEKEVLPGAGTFLWVEYWYAVVPLFVDVVLNNAITEQSHFVLEAKNKDDEWARVGASTQYFCSKILENPAATPLTDLISALSADPQFTDTDYSGITPKDIYTLITKGKMRVSDANGVPFTTQMRPSPEVRAAVDVANFDGSNVFYVWVSPKDVTISAKGITETVIPWNYFIPSAEGGLGHATFPFVLDASIEPGSNDLRNNQTMWTESAPDPDRLSYEYYIITHADQLNERMHMSLWPQVKSLLGGGNTGIGIQGVQRFGLAYSAFAEASLTGPGSYTLTVNVVQTGNYGFAPMDSAGGANINRKPPKTSEAELRYPFIITQ
ncbi:MAG: Ig-like domain-containing protein, partial [Clostridia bacterium]|nr:Ig-like domain-containing protein [Clostridia bacterium]